MDRLKDAQRADAEGDYSDPRKSREVDASYDDAYLQRRKDFVEWAKRKVKGRAKSKQG